MTSVPPQQDPRGPQQVPPGYYAGNGQAPAPGNGQPPPQAPAPAPSTSSSTRPPHGRGTLIAFIALLVVGVLWGLSAIGQTIITELQVDPLADHRPDSDVIVSPLNTLVSGTAGAVGLLVLTFLAFPYRVWHFVGLGIAVLHFLAQALLTLLTLSSPPVVIALIPLPRSVLILVAALIVVCLPAAYRARGMRNPLRIIAVTLAALPLALGGTIITTVTLGSLAPEAIDPGFLVSRVPWLLESTALAILVVLAALPWAWSRFTAAGLALIVFVIDVVGIVGTTTLPPFDAARPLIVVDAVVPGLAVALLVVAGVLTLRERRATTPPPPARQPVPAPPPYRT